MKKLNLGCGQIRPAGWINVDSSLNTVLQKWPMGKWLSRQLGAVEFDTSNVVYMNLNKRWKKFGSDSVDVVYASHLFEHLEISSAKTFLEEAYRTLKPNGCIRLVMPDLYAHCIEYIQNVDLQKEEASKLLLWALNLYKEGPDKKLSTLHNILGFFQGYPHRHKYMYDKLSLSRLYSEHGFREIRICTYGQSYYVSDINDVEGPHLYGGYPNSIYIEALK